jgi:hypothetical protein
MSTTETIDPELVKALDNIVSMATKDLRRAIFWRNALLVWIVAFIGLFISAFFDDALRPFVQFIIPMCAMVFVAGWFKLPGRLDAVDHARAELFAAKIERATVGEGEQA